MLFKKQLKAIIQNVQIYSITQIAELKSTVSILLSRDAMLEQYIL